MNDQVMKFIQVNDPEFREAMMDVVKKLWDKFVEEKRYVPMDGYLETKEAARFLGLDVSEESNYSVKMSRYTNINYFNPPLAVCKNLASDKYKVADLVEFADARRQRIRSVAKKKR